MSNPSVGGAQPGLATAARVAALVLAILSAYVALASFDGLASTFFDLQDRYVILGFGVSLLLLSLLARRTATSPAIDMGSVRIGAIAVAGTLALWAGTYLVMRDYALTRDEHMVVFDMGVFGSGRLAATVAPEWRDYALALVPAFLLDIPHHAALVSSYMPGNAALRTGFGSLADPALLNPLLAAIGLLALFDIVRRIFPDDREAQGVALLLYVTSTQVVVAAMTTYAMTAHLCLNLVWLALFLRDSRSAHAAAMMVGFVATGLHQVIFHPLFVLPFLIHLLQHRRWRTAGFYAVGYGAAGLFWLSYPHIVVSSLHLAAAGPPGTSGGPIAFLSTRVVPLLLERDQGALILMGANLLRFAAWQNVALIPLVLLALPVARHRDGIAQPLYLGVLFTLFAMFVLLPYQGHGWGYRYLHGLIGSMALLAGFGWQRLAGVRDGARAFLRAATAVTLVCAMPFLLWTTHNFVTPYADVDAAIRRLDVDVAVIDTEDVAFAVDEVRNRADLSNRPIRLSSKDLSAAQLRHLCETRSVAFVDRAAMQALGLGREHPPQSPRFDALRAAVQGKCGRARKVSVNQI